MFPVTSRSIYRNQDISLQEQTQLQCATFTQLKQFTQICFTFISGRFTASLGKQSTRMMGTKWIKVVICTVAMCSLLSF